MRHVAWFSCGAASAVAAKKIVDKYAGSEEVAVVYCDTMATEHPDNSRFFDDVQEWLGVSILKLKSAKYEDIDDVFDKTRYMAGVYGARCTTEMKKVPRFKFQRPDDIHTFGFTSEEKPRRSNFEKHNPELHLEWILFDEGISKLNCHEVLQRAGIKLPEMYTLGYRNNNCLGCVKATGRGYWAKVRKDFPEIFEKRCVQSRKLGVKLIRVDGKRVFLDELPAGDFKYKRENLPCGPECGVPNEEK